MSGADEPAVMAALLPEAPPPHGAICRPFKPRLPLRSEYFPKPGKRCAGSRLSRIVRRHWCSHFFRARGSPPDFPAAARRPGKMSCRRFRSGRAAAFRLRAFLSRDKDWSFRDGGRLGDFAPDF